MDGTYSSGFNLCGAISSFRKFGKMIGLLYAKMDKDEGLCCWIVSWKWGFTKGTNVLLDIKPFLPWSGNMPSEGSAHYYKLTTNLPQTHLQDNTSLFFERWHLHLFHQKFLKRILHKQTPNHVRSFHKHQACHPNPRSFGRNDHSKICVIHKGFWK